MGMKRVILFFAVLSITAAAGAQASAWNALSDKEKGFLLIGVTMGTSYSNTLAEAVRERVVSKLTTTNYQDRLEIESYFSLLASAKDFSKKETSDFMMFGVNWINNFYSIPENMQTSVMAAVGWCLLEYHKKSQE